MVKYKYLIYRETDGYYFGLYPNNSNTQSVGRSEPYASQDEAEKALQKFKVFFEEHQDRITDYVSFDDNKFFFTFEIDGHTIRFFRCLKYRTQKLCSDGVNRVREHFNADLRVQKIKKNRR